MKITCVVAAVLTATSLLTSTAYAQEESPGAEGQTESGRSPAREIEAIVTGYATGSDGGAIGSITATGTVTHWGTVAADWHLYPPGTRLQIEGFPDQIFTVEDSGGAVHGNIFDVWFPDLATAVAFGTKTLRVTVLGSPP